MHILRAVLRRHRLVAFALSRIMRASDPAHVASHPPVAKRLHLLCENAPNLPLSKAQKARSTIIFLSKRLPYVVFWRLSVLAARRFVGARKQIPLFAYFIDNSGYRSVRAVANGCICRYFGLSRAHRFFPRLRACFEK